MLNTSNRFIRPCSKFLKGLLMLTAFTLHFSCIVKSQSGHQKIRVIVIGAHPDDCDIDAGGTAILLANLGDSVKFLSLTNGDAGHQTESGAPLAKRRLLEAREAASRSGVVYDVLDNHDGKLMPSLEVRMQVIRKIREWKADLVIAPRTNDYHPDHRYTGVLVQDAAYMVAVPDIYPEIAPLKKNPVFLYVQDKFQRPNPFRPDIAVDITAIYSKKVYAMDAHVSQMYEWLPYIKHILEQVPKGKSERLAWLAVNRKVPITDDVRKSLIKWYGSDIAMKVENAEAFEVCEYGTQPTPDDIRKLFPFYDKK